MANAEADQRVDPIHIAAPGDGPAAGDDQTTDLQVAHQAKIDVQVLVPIASARQQVDRCIALEGRLVLEAPIASSPACNFKRTPALDDGERCIQVRVCPNG